MKIECLIEKIKKALSSVERVTGKNLTLPVLSSILWVATNKSLKLRATNLNIGVEIDVPAKIEEEGTVAVRGDILSSLFSTRLSKSFTTGWIVDNSFSVEPTLSTVSTHLVVSRSELLLDRKDIEVFSEYPILYSLNPKIFVIELLFKLVKLLPIFSDNFTKFVCVTLS